MFEVATCIVIRENRKTMSHVAMTNLGSVGAKTNWRGGLWILGADTLCHHSCQKRKGAPATGKLHSPCPATELRPAKGLGRTNCVLPWLAVVWLIVALAAAGALLRANKCNFSGLSLRLGRRSKLRKIGKPLLPY